MMMEQKIIKPFIVREAKIFWEQTKVDLTPPYDIEQAVALVLPLNIVTMSDLSFKRIQEWFSNQGVVFKVGFNNRLIHGFLTCSQGEGFVFVNGTDSDDERRFTIAHETSHFIIEYHNPRLKAISKFGIKILPVLDGLRVATVEERIDGILSNIAVRKFAHLLEKSGTGDFASYYNWSAENYADALAVELLAPIERVCNDVLSKLRNPTYMTCKGATLEILKDKYRLPISIASQYASKIAYSLTGGTTIVDKLGLRK